MSSESVNDEPDDLAQEEKAHGKGAVLKAPFP